MRELERFLEKGTIAHFTDIIRDNFKIWTISHKKRFTHLYSPVIIKNTILDWKNNDHEVRKSKTHLQKKFVHIEIVNTYDINIQKIKPQLPFLEGNTTAQLN